MKTNIEQVLRDLLYNCYEYRKLDQDIDRNLIRLVPPAYGDGLNTPSGDSRPSARVISNELFSQEEPVPNDKCVNNLLWLFGQLLDHDITLVHDGSEYFNIPVPQGDPHFDPNFNGNVIIPLKRSEFDPTTGINSPREQVNSITPLIDAGNIYGDTTERNHYIRLFKDGLLKTCVGDLLPVTNGHLENAGHAGGSIFIAGDIRANEHTGLTIIHIIFMREHNYWARLIKKYYPKLCDEEIYQRARLMVESELQAITFNEFLPILLGKNGTSQYNGYDENVNVQMSNVFSAGGFRLHTLIPSQLYKDHKLKDTFFSPHILCNEIKVETALRRFLDFPCETFDIKFVDDLRNFLFGEPGDGGFDLAALNIQRGRDHGIPDYNTCRAALGLNKLTSFSDFDCPASVQTKLQDLYGDIDNVDFYVGGLLEKPVYGGFVGPLFAAIIKDQFERLRNGDPLWYERRLTAGLIKHINCTKLSDIIRRNTYICDIQKCSFIIKSCCKCK